MGADGSGRCIFVAVDVDIVDDFFSLHILRVQQLPFPNFLT